MPRRRLVSALPTDFQFTTRLWLCMCDSIQVVTEMCGSGAGGLW